MIKAYLAGISTTYEGEDIQVQYCILEDGAQVAKQSLYLDYRKPAVVGQVALQTLLNELKDKADQEIVICMNDATINEIISGTTTTHNQDVLKMAVITRKRLSRFTNLLIKDVGKEHDALAEWTEMLKF
jgi:hypothetical protein